MSVIDDLGFAGLGFNSPSGEPRTPVIDGWQRWAVCRTTTPLLLLADALASSPAACRYGHRRTVRQMCRVAIPLGMTTIADKL